MIYQKTLAKEATVTGIGLHSGRKITLKLIPASSDFGIQFKRSDIKNSPLIAANYKTVSATSNNTTIGQKELAIHTIEHLLSVLYGFGIDNLLCEVDGPEVPILDGSSSPFVYLIKDAGIKLLSLPKKFLIIKKPVSVTHQDKWAKIVPHSNLSVDSTIVFNHPKIKKQRLTFEFSCSSYFKELARARTFGLLSQIEDLQKAGLAKGGSLDNAIVLDEFNVLNRDGLRFSDEFVRHKILDTIGDIALTGLNVVGKITTYKSGHLLHNMLCHQIFASISNYEILSALELEEQVTSLFELKNMNALLGFR